MITTLLAVLVVALLFGPWFLLSANRLDRLHVRTDAAWSALDAVLARRAVVVRAVAAAGCLEGASAGALRTAADRAEHAARPDRETAENELSRLLGDLDRAELPSALAAELADAEQRVVLSRRVHNDAVRDTLSLRRRHRVRWFRLAGTARQPEYFEIAEPDVDGEGGTAALVRPAARILLVDGLGRVLLFEGHDPARPQESFWFTVGGAVEPGEHLRAAATRELREETGLAATPDELVGPVWRRRVVFSFDGRTYDAEEWFFVLRVDNAVVDTSGFTELEARTVRQHRWWTGEDLRATEEVVYPVELASLLPELLTIPWNGKTRTVR